MTQGIVLGPDGKPCRTCNTLKDFQSAKMGLGTIAGMGLGAGAGSAAGAERKDCPPDVEELGRSTWTFLHSMAAQYPEKPSVAEQAEMKSFLTVFSKVYPCWHCAQDFRTWIKTAGNEPRVESRDALGSWLCNAHNEVNTKLGKKEFDCGRWLERWRDGWKDGSCD